MIVTIFPVRVSGIGGAETQKPGKPVNASRNSVEKGMVSAIEVFGVTVILDLG